LQTLVLPYQRTSPVHQPRRDLVLSSSDCLYLRVSVIEADDPNAMALELSGGIGGPGCRLVLFHDRPYGGCGWDYGAPTVPYGHVLGVWDGFVADAPGSFDFDIPSGAFSDCPLRCGWAIVLDWDVDHAEVLASGFVHFRPGGAVFGGTPLPHLMTDTYEPLHTDTEEHLFA
jgi:hypothetical protein